MIHSIRFGQLLRCAYKCTSINFRLAADVHLPGQTVRNRLNDDCTRARRPARGPGLTAYTMQCESACSRTSEPAASSLEANIPHR